MTPAERRWVAACPDPALAEEAERLLRRAAWCETRAGPGPLGDLWLRHARRYRQMAGECRRLTLAHRRRFPAAGRESG